MFRAGSRIIISASDIAAASVCGFAAARRLDVLHGRASPEAAAPDAMLARTSALGAAHEQRILEALEERLGRWQPGRGGGVHRLPDRPSTSTRVLEELREETLGALRGGADAVYQGTFFDGEFSGRADFLVRAGLIADDPALLLDEPVRAPSGDADEPFAVVDTKLARSAKVQALLQLGAYADQLERIGVPVASRAHLVLGTGARESVPVADILPVYRERRAELRRLIAAADTLGAPAEWGDPRFPACGRCEICEAEAEARGDLLLVATMSMGQRKRLRAQGITTIGALAALPGPPAGVPAGLWHQARLQESGTGADAVIGGVAYQVHDASQLGMIPAPSEGDVFFDFEGDPLFADPAGKPGDWGLEYLFGVLEAPQGHEPGTFRPFWAHSRAEEREALTAFLDYVRRRRARWPDMHVYHYAPYENAALKRLAARHGTGEDIVDELLRDGVLVDLYPVVRKSLRISQRSYSIKKLEPLYMGAELREAEVQNAADSVVAYADYCAARDSGEEKDADRILQDIREYNRYDCLSTLKLRDWLLRLAAERGVPAGSRVPDPEPPADDDGDPELLDRRRERAEAELARAESVRALLEFAGPERAGRSAEQRAVALVAAAVDYYAREDKPHWWAHFARLTAPAEELVQQRDVFLSEAAELLDDWHKPGPRARLLARRLRLSGRWAEGSTARAGTKVLSLYDRPQEGMATSGTGGRAWLGGVEIESSESHAEADELVILEKLRTGMEPFDALPVALVPGDPVPTRGQREAVAEYAARLAASLPELPDDCALDILRLRPPRLPGGLPSADEGHVVAITRALQQLRDSYIAVQGPPGTGKTHTGSRVISELSAAGWRIGVVGQSHSVVENMLRAVIKAGVPADLVAKKAEAGRKREAPSGSADAGPAPLTTTEAFRAFLAREGCVVGGTVWDFVNPHRFAAGELDLLVIDEAGQFSLANTIAVSRAARRLLLLGDPQQLPQVSQGLHPEPVDASALGWLAGDNDTLPPEFGYFLDRSWRMHPDLCEAVSRLSYDGKLEAAPIASARSLEGMAPGMHTVLVEHEGNATSSPEEAAEIVRRIRALLGAAWDDGDGKARPLGQADVLVVAAYNAQVGVLQDALAESGLGNVSVGTVDRFQGRQAPVVFVSMAASSAEDVPRGMEFLLSRNRINVAVSRAQWAACLVRAPRLTAYLPATPRGLGELGAFIGLSEAGR